MCKLRKELPPVNLAAVICDSWSGMTGKLVPGSIIVCSMGSSTARGVKITGVCRSPPLPDGVGRRRLAALSGLPDSAARRQNFFGSYCILITSTIKVKSHKKVCMNSNYANQFIIVTTWTSRRLIPAEAWLFVLHLVQDNNKETSNRHTDNPLWPESISNKGPVTRKTFSCHHVIEICTFMPRTDYPLCNCGFQRDNTIRLTWSCKFERWIRCYMRCHYGSRALLSQHAVEGTNYGL